ncbi:MAG TPA: hypothetical protein VF869_09235 [Jatrophihabitantaceae bacterium]|nr:hypothetical protein [Jatrophihabitantaceae bacterium]HYU65585.1 hypothetical protein [Jatrophihabitantaceae bacterium]
MSDLLTSGWDDDEDPESRRNAVRGLIVLAVLAVLVIAGVLVIVGTSGGNHNRRLADDATILPTEPAPTTPASEPPSTPTTSASITPSTSAHPTPTSTANPCLSAGPCAVDGDDGGVVDAVNKFRVSHGRTAVSGTVSAKAQQCALKQGEGPSCDPHFAWEAVPTQDGQQVVSMITARGEGKKWLLDAGITSFSIGWAYAPGSGYECAILKFP